MDINYDIISYDSKVPAAIRTEKLDKGARRTELLWHKEPEFIYVTNGAAECVVNGEEQTLNAGEFILLNSEDVHLVRPGRNSGCSLLFVIFSPEYIKQFRQNVDGILFFVNSEDGTRETLAKLLEELAQTFDNPSDYKALLQIACVNKIYYLMLERCVCYRRMNVSMKTQKKDFSHAKTALSYINENYSREISLDEISSVVNLSPSYFSKYFKKVTQVSFSEYLANLRLEKAINDMFENNTSVSAAAQRNGFANVKSFITQCKKVYNCTPGQHKKKLLQDQQKTKAK